MLKKITLITQKVYYHHIKCEQVDTYKSNVVCYFGQLRINSYELQQRIQDIYKKIKHHNYYLRYIAELQDKDNATNIPESTFRYYELLDKDEKSILSDIPLIMEKLKDEFEFEFPN